MNIDVIEKILKSKHMVPQLKVLEKLYAKELKCYHISIDPDEFEAYSTNSHSFEDVPVEFRALLGGNDFYQTDIFSNSGLESLTMYSSSTVPRSGDKIEQETAEGSIKSYIVDKVEQIGTSANVFYKYTLSGIEE